MRICSFFSAVYLTILLSACNNQQQRVEILSPNEHIQLTITNQLDGSVAMQIRHHTQELWRQNMLQLHFVEHKSMRYFKILKVQSVAHEHGLDGQNYHELFVVLRELDHHRIAHIRVRIFNRAVAFRYEFPIQPSLVDFKLDLTNQTLPTEETISMPYELDLAHDPQYPSKVSPWFIYQNNRY